MLREPLSFSGISDLVFGFLNAIAYVALPAFILAVVAIGFMYVFAQGDKSAITSAHKSFFWVLVAAVLILGIVVFFTIANNLIRFLLGY